MNRNAEFINARYDALMFAKTREKALEAARDLVRAVLGEEANGKSLETALRETCRVLRPSQDPREEQRFEAEFVELGIWPNGSQSIAA